MGWSVVTADKSDAAKSERAAYTSRGSASAPPTIKGYRVTGGATPSTGFRPYVRGAKRSAHALAAMKRMPAIPPGQ